MLCVCYIYIFKSENGILFTNEMLFVTSREKEEKWTLVVKHYARYISIGIVILFNRVEVVFLHQTFCLYFLRCKLYTTFFSQVGEKLDNLRVKLMFVDNCGCSAEKAMAPHSTILAWRIPGTVEPGGLPSMGSHRVGHDWSDLAAAVVVL